MATQKKLDIKTIVLFSLLIPSIAYFLSKRDNQIDLNAANNAASANALINISHQMTEIISNQHEQTDQIRKNAEGYHALDRKISIICSNQKQYWNVHGCTD